MDKSEKVKDKLICLDQIWIRVEELMKKQRISQVDMVRLCQRKGYSIQQPEISKLKSGKCKITLYQLIFSCKWDILRSTIERRRSNHDQTRTVYEPHPSLHWGRTD